MPHISSKKLDKSFVEKLFKKFITVLGRAQNKNSLSLVMKELLTKTEKIMFVKRLSIILMLANSLPQHKIVDILGVSPSTVAKISLHLEIGKYDNILKVSEKEKVDLEKLIWNILTVGGIMPPKVGKKYWRRI
jgi:Trp operon repressor